MFGRRDSASRHASPASSIGSHVSGISHPPRSSKRQRSSIFSNVSSEALMQQVEDWDDGTMGAQSSPNPYGLPVPLAAWGVPTPPEQRAPSPYTQPVSGPERSQTPLERNLGNIDLLIARATNEEELRELKQQKRLLRNRQAALDSRQRRVAYTEKLEAENKQLTRTITELEGEIYNFRAREHRLLQENENLVKKMVQFALIVDVLPENLDDDTKPDDITELGKKYNVLREAMGKVKSELWFRASEA